MSNTEEARTMKSMEFAEAMFAADVSYAPKDPDAYQLQYADHLADAALTFLRERANDPGVVDAVFGKMYPPSHGVGPNFTREKKTKIRIVVGLFLDAVEDLP